MPRKRQSSIGRYTPQARRQRVLRESETNEEQQLRLEANRAHTAEARTSETTEQRAIRLELNRVRNSQARTSENPEQRQIRLEANRVRTSEARASEIPQQREIRLQADRIRTSEARTSEIPQQRQIRLQTDRVRTSEARTSENPEQRQIRLAADRLHHIESTQILHIDLNLCAFQYNPNITYNLHPGVIIGKLDQVCKYCNALKFKNETPGMCCAGGKVQLPELLIPPEPLLTLVSGNTDESKHFLINIRKYNSSFQMTSFGANIVRENFMPTFKVQGQIYHRAGSLLPPPDTDYQFLQIYFMPNTDEQINQRCKIYTDTRKEIITSLQHLFHEHNQLIKLFKTQLEQMITDDYKLIIKPDQTPTGQHERRYNAPTSTEVAIVMVGEEFNARDIVLHRRNNEIKRIPETHRSYDALQYPILFWHGEDGYHFNLKLIDPQTKQETTKKISAMQYYAYKLMIRQNTENHILKCRQLFHQYIVDMFVKIETERLLYIRLNQKKLRSEEYIHLRDAIINDNANPNDLGKMVILPSTFTGSPRHMHEHAQDAMAYVRAYGRPDFFITFTCNPKWDEIKEILLPGQLPSDRHDILARVFKQKLKSLMNFIIKYCVFGKVRCWMYSIEWQKRGLPHGHILIWLFNKITPDKIDEIISAEIPDEQTDPELFKIITKNMIHGPCGLLNRNSQCMSNNKCTKLYPRALRAETMTGNDGYPLYRRRSTEDGGKSFILKRKKTHSDNSNDNYENIEIDNRWVVPYSPILSKTFDAHINFELCNSVKAIKYICKYINKGHDMAVFEVGKPNDEIEQYQSGRYISSNEAIWRINGFPIHEKYPTVVHLSVHLKNGQRVYFTPENVIDKTSQPPKTTLTEFFSLCENDIFAKTLLYTEVPKYYTWNNKQFKRRKQGQQVEGYNNLYSTDALGRMYTVHPNNGECFYLRLLLINVRGPTSFDDLKTVNGELCATYREACQKLNLLENDSQWDISLNEASNTALPNQIRTLFAIIVTTCFPSNPQDLWDKYKNYMSEDILHRIRSANQNLDIQFDQHIYNDALICIEDLCLKMTNKRLDKFGLAAPDRSGNDIFDRDFVQETHFDTNILSEFVKTNLPKLNSEQRLAYDKIIDTIKNQSGGLFFLDAPGGTGKTFLISLILATIRSTNNIALAMASSGIAATLLDGGRTAHSALKLPLDMRITDTICNITKNSGMAKILKSCQIIIWDECTMAHKKALQGLNDTLKDFRGNNKLFGGALILLSGDFRQTLPVIQHSTAADQLDACLKSSVLWKYVQKLTLSTNMRIQLQNDTSDNFGKLLLDIGNGKLLIDEYGDITLIENLCQIVDNTNELIKNVFPNIRDNYKNVEWLSERAILAPINQDVTIINLNIQNELPGDAITYKSYDTVINPDEAVNFPTEFLNSLDLPGIPPHILTLKIGTVIILLRNLKPPQLCNGTRLYIKNMLNNIIEATILTGKFKGETVLLPRIPLIPTNINMPFEFKRLQFPVRLAFAMTINKAQGQSLKVCGLNLKTPCFSHGQLYVACSRVGKPTDLFVYAPNKKTRNIVYPKALQ